MFEAHVLHLLRKYLGEYVQGLSAEALRISVWKGDVVLKDLQLRAEALNSLKLPVTVKAGFVGTITLKVPWKSLGKEPVIVLIDRVFILAHPAPDGQTLNEEDREKLFEAKLQQIEEAESATLEAKARMSKMGNPPGGNSWLGSLIATIIGNLKISISNVHFRYEDTTSNPGHPFCSGVTLAKLAAVTMDEQGNETFDTSGALDKLQKSLQLQRLALYHDSDSQPWKLDKKWENLSPKEWVKIFEDGIDEPKVGSTAISAWSLDRKYLVSPINGVLKYHRLGKQERKDPEIPFERASLVLSDVSLTVSEAQYYDGIKLLEVISRYKTHIDVSHLRPGVPVSVDSHVWWRYAVQAGLQQKKMCYRFSWERIRHLCQLRRRYIQLYASSLQQLSKVDNSELRQIEKDLDSKVILLWRLLSHAKVESVKSKEAAQQRVQTKRNWWSFGWRTSSGVSQLANDSEESQLLEERLTKEEWQAINKLLSYQPEEEFSFHFGKDSQNMIQFLVNISIGQAAARIINIKQTEIVCGRFEQLEVTTKLYPKHTLCDLTLKFYGLSAPEGSLAQSVSSEKKVNALAASFVHSPAGENVDWRLSATIAPCHVSVLMESYERFLEFVRRSNAVSPTVALETATALQMKIEQVTRKAQEQFQLVLEEQSRFALDIDFDAPKVRVPMKATPSLRSDCHFLLDFGNFTLHTMEGQRDDERQSLYSRFYISGRDIAAFFIDGALDCEIHNLAPIFGSQLSSFPISENVDRFYSLIDRCGTSVIVDQIKIPHPRYPSTRVSVQVPNLGIHFSLARYRRIMDLLEILYGDSEIGDQMGGKDLQSAAADWLPADLSTNARILIWRGIGNSVAEWKPCFLVLSGLFLYVLESESSQSYQRCSSMAGRQVFEVSPASVGGSQYSVAVSFRGLDVQKALESSNTIIMEFRDDDEKAIWIRGLIQATYRASAPPSIDILGESSGDIAEFGGSRPTNERADLIINGTLVETKLLIYGKSEEGKRGALEETLILEVLAGGGKVNLIRLDGDLTVKTKLHSLKIKDELQGHLSTTPQYLACSVLKEGLDGNDLSKMVFEEDDVFKDALAEFTPLPDQNFSSQILDPYCTNLNPDIIERGVGIDASDILVHGNEPVRGRCGSGEVFYEAHDNDMADFVAVTFLMRHPGSHMYDGTDMQMSIRMSKLDFFFNRPTLVALIEFGMDLSQSNLGVSGSTQLNGFDADSSQDRERTEGNERAYVKGLLGHGKGRVVFYLNMDVKSVCIVLNKEDGSQLAMLVQENFRLDLKVHPSSLSMDGTVGNLRFCDMTLGADHCWGWLCDTRNQRIKSLIKFEFQSYNAEDDDYEGYDYSLFGRLSAVRIVFLYRFVQEITAYFMELASPHTEEVVKFVDKVGGIEWLIQKYEIDGATALKLDLLLDTPIIIVPRNSMSKDFMQLDLGRLQVRNSFSWHGSEGADPSAVHLDVLDAEIHGINMAVGIDGHIGKPMVREGEGLHIQVRRSLRDVFRKVPTMAVEVRVGLLHGLMSDKEYNVILDCAYMNISEDPRLPPSFRKSNSHQKDSLRMPADKVNSNSQTLLSRTIFLVAVEVNYAVLELCNGTDHGSPLAHIALEGLWISYRSTSLSETDLYITIPKFSILDIRPDTKPEMSLMLGSSSDVSRQGICGDFDSTENLSTRKSSENAADMDPPNLTMLLIDYRLRQCSQSYVVRIQQPHVLVVLDFLLAVAEFFVPALGAITGREESLHPKNDPIAKDNHIVLSTPIFEQRDTVVHLSPNRQLIADAFDVDEFTYDGCGGTIYLSQESDSSENLSSNVPPVIIIGNGKKLRFKNVKFENGHLLRKCTYMGHDSCYLVSVEDGVNISLLEDIAFDMDTMALDNSYGSSDTSNVAASDGDTNLSETQNVTFEVQVMSPEFTFYDSKKASLDDSLHDEKLLRVKMEISFMYAAKDKDTWMWALVKDLSIEAGSGLVILDPVDISGGFTSVKDKTNISVVSTDICIHLSLSVISLVLHLQNQAAAALQFGNASAVSSCNNFDRVWSLKGNGPGNGLTIWRPQAPSNYAILGDCVTSGPTPPSQAVMALSNIYGRVQKPVGFNFIGFISSYQGIEGEKTPSDIDFNCSLWMPIAPSGYIALGCVAHLGSEPPPNHIVYCVRSDLVTSTTFGDCIFYIPPNSRFSSGFSIWSIDNTVGSFYAHSTTECPPKIRSCDLREILHRSPNWPKSSSLSSTSDPSVENDTKSQQGSSQSTGSSRWDIIRSISRSSYYLSTPHFERIWWDKGCDLRRPVSIWRPQPRPGFSILGDCITEGLEPPAFGLLFKKDSSGISAKPVQFTKIAHIVGKGLDEAFFWYPIAPPGYASLGCMVSRTDETPAIDSLCCLRMDLVNPANIFDVPITKSSSSKGSYSWSIWKVENQACTFLARSDLKKPSSRLAYSIGDYVKPKARDDVSAVMKLRCFSLTVLDSLCGMMTPLFDATVTDLNFASHGRLEAINAVLTSSIAASTFNTQLEAWEPLIEPFEGIFKFESFDSDTHLPSRNGKRLRVAATSTVNLNVSAANLGTFAESVVSWRRLEELELKSMKSGEDAGNNLSRGDDSTRSALEEDDFQTVMLENKLGSDIYLKKIVQNSKAIELLKHDQCASALLPPPRFSDRLNVATEMCETRQYVAIHILESRGLAIVDDGNKHDFFCALRLVADNQSSDQQKLFPQSARTRCVRPLLSETNNLEDCIARWNELFIFEVPRKGPANLEVEVTNLAAKAGKGEVIGAFSIPIVDCATMLKETASLGMMQHKDDAKMLTYQLKRRGRSNRDEERKNCGSLLISTSYFEKKKHVNFQRETTNTVSIDGDVAFWVGLSPEGPWESFRPLLPLSVIPKTLTDDLFAFEVVMKNGKKHAILRSLAVVVNDTDVNLEVSICPSSMLDNYAAPSSSVNSHTVVTEEIFENQRYQPISGWGYKKLGFLGSDPWRWSTREFSYSSKDFFEPSLPSGWQWISDWSVEKSQFVDSDGWAYGPEYQSLKWPPISSKSCRKSALDFVRRRRWIRTRQLIPGKNTTSSREVLFLIAPRSSAVLPWRSIAKNNNFCLQVRPYVENHQAPYSWSHTVNVGSSYISGNDQYFPNQNSQSTKTTTQSGSNPMPISEFKLNQLEKKDVLLASTSSSSNKQLFWLSAGTDASVLHTELNSPVYDWKISINAPLKIENRLPCCANYAIWERTKEGKRVQRQAGILSSGGSAFIYLADVQTPIYLTWFPQGGWYVEKNAILILDPSSLDHVSSFWMVHQQTNRRLRVSIERDLGGTTAAPKTIRLFVPYWISNDSSLPLTYRIVEVEPWDRAETDSPSLSKVMKLSKVAVKHPSSSDDRRRPSSRKTIQILEPIEELSSTPVMLSPQDYTSRGGIVPFPSRNDTFLSPRLGIAVSIRLSENYSPGISLVELENKERIDFNAFSSNGSYFKLSAFLSMASDRTKVVHFQPQTVFVNRVGHSVCLQQCGTQYVEWFHPTDPPKLFQWQSTAKNELLQLRLDGYKWSTPFSVESEGVMRVSLKTDMGGELMFIRVQVMNGTKSSRYQVVFHLTSSSSPYRIENRSMFLPMRLRQVGGTDDSWLFLPTNAAISFFWEDLGRQRLLEVLVDGTDPLKSEKYNIDEICDHQPVHISGGPMKAIRVTVQKESKIHVIRISDWMPANETLEIMPQRMPLPLPPSENEFKETASDSNSEFHVIVELAEMGLSIIDHTPEEILYLSVQNLLLSYDTGMGSGISRFKFRMGGFQVDNQLPLTPMPVLFRPQKVGDQLDYILKLSVTMQANGLPDFYVYPYLGFQGPQNSAFLINIHEPVIWRLHEMFQQINPRKILGNQTTVVPVDPIIQIRLLNISEIRFKVSMTMSPTQRPRGVLGFWASLMTALGNMEHMPVRINQRFNEDICMRQSALINAAISSIQKDLLSQPLQLLSGVDILGNASSALGHMSKGVAALSMDKKFIRQRQEGKGTVEDIGDVIREGGGALAKGLFRGVTGILTKPLEGAKSSGVEGFVQGVGKGIIGAAAQPVSGVLDLLSKTTEGANAVRMKIASAITSEEQLLRRRLPRVISGDNVLCPYDEYRAQGLIILQLAESGALLGQMDLFKVRGKFALSDAYEDHFILPKGKILMVTHRRVLLMQQPSQTIAQKKFNPARDPCSVLWDVLWEDLITMELTLGKKDQPKSSPSQLILYLRNRSMEGKEYIRVIKCHRESKQAEEIYSSIEQAMNAFGPNHSKEMQKRKVTKPYSPSSGSVYSEALPKEVFGIWRAQEAMVVPLSSTFGTLSTE